MADSILSTPFPSLSPPSSPFFTILGISLSLLPLSVLYAALTCPPLHSCLFFLPVSHSRATPSRFSLRFPISSSFLDSPTPLQIPPPSFSRPRPHTSTKEAHTLVVLLHATPPTSTNGAKVERVLVRMHARFALPLLSHPFHRLSPCLPPPPPAPNCSDNSSGYLTIPSYLIYLFLSLHTALSPLQTPIFSCHHRELRSVEWSK